MDTGPTPPAEIASRRSLVALWIASAVFLVVMAVPAFANAMQSLDDRVWQLAVDLENPMLVSIAELLDVVGGVVAMAIVVTVVAVALAWQRRGLALAIWLLVAAASQGLNVLIKELYERPRPPLPLIETNSWSFVSGHSLTAAAVAITLVLISGAEGGRQRGLLIVAVAYAIVMASSRVYLRAHWLSDVTAGVVIGTAIALSVSLALVVTARKQG